MDEKKPFVSEPVSNEKEITLVKETPEGGKVFEGRPKQKVSEQPATEVAPPKSKSASKAAPKVADEKSAPAQEK